MSDEHTTSATLLGRLRHSPTDEPAWNQFVIRYAPRIYSWCVHWGLQSADAEDVTQGVLTTLAVRMKTFEYDPSQRFRAWLRVVTRNAWLAFVEARKSAAVGSGDSVVERLLGSVEARDDLARRLEQEFDQELLGVVLERVRGWIEPRTWDAFRFTALEQRPAAEAAESLGMNLAAVYMARSRVQKMIRDELARVDAS